MTLIFDDLHSETCFQKEVAVAEPKNHELDYVIYEKVKRYKIPRRHYHGRHTPDFEALRESCG